MLESLLSLWQKQTDENKSLVKRIAMASIAVYVVLQLLSFILPIALAIGLGIWIYKGLIDKNPKILR